MKKVTCDNCGAIVPEGREQCPYCGTTSRVGVQRGWRAKVRDVVNRILGLEGEAYRSLSRMILVAFLRGVAIAAAVVLLAFAWSQFVDVNYSEDYEYDLRTQENIKWAEENLDKLDEAYEAGDYQKIRALSFENYDVVSTWPRYSECQLRMAHRDIMQAPRLDVFELQRALYFLYMPEYYVEHRRMATVDKEVYESLQKDVLDRMAQEGYTEAELRGIYDACADSHGYLTAGELEEYVRGGDDA